MPYLGLLLVGATILLLGVQSSPITDTIEQQIPNINFPLTLDSEENTRDDLSFLNDPELDEGKIELLTMYLTKVLQEPWIDGIGPLVYIENYSDPSENQINTSSEFSGAARKRSRYYRRYPWKRQNSRSRTYESDNRYLCQPSRDDVYQLLVALHASRQGNGIHSVNFCNRRRPASTIFTNIRYLGRK